MGDGGGGTSEKKNMEVQCEKEMLKSHQWTFLIKIATIQFLLCGKHFSKNSMCCINPDKILMKQVLLQPLFTNNEAKKQRGCVTCSVSHSWCVRGGRLSPGNLTPNPVLAIKLCNFLILDACPMPDIVRNVVRGKEQWEDMVSASRALWATRKEMCKNHYNTKQNVTDTIEAV